MLALTKMEEVLQNVVTLVKEYQSGIPVKKLGLYYNKKYHSNLSPRALNFNSMLSLVSALEDLVVKENLVLHKDHCHQSQAETGDELGAAALHGASAVPQEDVKIVGALKKVVAMMMEHPEGILLKEMKMYYKQMYHQKLALASLGFKSLASLVESLKPDLVVKGGNVFHRIYLPENQPGPRRSTSAEEDSRPRTPLTPDPLVRTSAAAAWAPGPQQDASVLLTQPGLKFGAPLVAFPSAPGNLVVPASTPAQPLTQAQLYQRVLQVSSYMLTNVEALYGCI